MLTPLKSSLEKINLADRNSLDRKINSAKLNVEVSSILLAAISISFGLSDLCILFSLTRFSMAICLGLGVLLLIIAIVLEADAVFYYSRGSEKLGDLFDRRGYQSMRLGLLFSLITLNYIILPMITERNIISPFVLVVIELSTPGLNCIKQCYQSLLQSFHLLSGEFIRTEN